MSLPPKRREENILTPSMVRTIFTTGAFFVVVILGLLWGMKGSPDSPGWFAGQGDWSVGIGGSRVSVPAKDLKPDPESNRWRVSENYPDERLAGREVEVSFTVLQVSLFFSIYVFFQVWNQINSRSLVPEVSGFHRILENRTFLTVAATVAVGQLLIVTFGGPIFEVEPLSPLQWLAVITFTASVLVFAEASRRIRLALARTEGTA
jgi:Ca2+-transporting ATPase